MYLLNFERSISLLPSFPKQLMFNISWFEIKIFIKEFIHMYFQNLKRASLCFFMRKFVT